MKKLALTGMLLFAPCAEAREIAILFSSMNDTVYSDPIDKNAVWRGTALTYQAIRNLGISKEDIVILYNDAKPDRNDTGIPLSNELNDNIILRGEYRDLEKVFNDRVKGLETGDMAILVTATHGSDDGVLLANYGNHIHPRQINSLLSSTKARTLAFYFACHSGAFLDFSDAKNAVQVSYTDRSSLSWSDRNYFGGEDFFSAFAAPEADADNSGKVSFEEAAAYTKMKWNRYKDNSLEDYLLNVYIWPKGLSGFASKTDAINNISCNPQLKRGKQIPTEWTLEKKP